MLVNVPVSNELTTGAVSRGVLSWLAGPRPDLAESWSLVTSAFASILLTPSISHVHTIQLFIQENFAYINAPSGFYNRGVTLKYALKFKETDVFKYTQDYLEVRYLEPFIYYLYTEHKF